MSSKRRLLHTVFCSFALVCATTGVNRVSAAQPESAASAGQAPVMTVAEPVHDFGTVGQGQELRHVFTISNSGTGVLELLDVKPACGCTTTGEWPHSLKPGAAGEIPVKLDTAHFTGSISKTISVYTNDPAHPEVTLELKARIWTPITIANPVLIFPAVAEPKLGATRSTTIRNETDTPLALTDVQSDNPIFKAQLKEVVPGKEYELIASTVPPLPDGTQTARISVKTSNEKMPELSVQAVVTVLPPIQIAPTEIAFGASKLEAPEKRFAVVLNHRATDLKVSDLSINAPGVQLTTTLSPDGKQFTVTLVFPAGFEIRPGDKYMLRGKTNQPAAPSFEIPIVLAGGSQ